MPASRCEQYLPAAFDGQLTDMLLDELPKPESNHPRRARGKRMPAERDVVA
jgi:hypothetical protein